MCFVSLISWSSESDVISSGYRSVRRQCGPVVGVPALRSGDPGFKTRSDHSLNLFQVVPRVNNETFFFW